MAKMLPDAMRAIMLHIEDAQDASIQILDVRHSAKIPERLRSFSSEDLRHNMILLVDKEFIIARHQAAFVFEFERLTASGSEFLETIRDPAIWAKTKEGALGAGGFTVDVLKDLAKGFIRQQIEERTGVKL